MCSAHGTAGNTMAPLGSPSSAAGGPQETPPDLLCDDFKYVSCHSFQVPGHVGWALGSLLMLHHFTHPNMSVWKEPPSPIPQKRKGGLWRSGDLPDYSLIPKSKPTALPRREGPQDSDVTGTSRWGLVGSEALIPQIQQDQTACLNPQNQILKCREVTFGWGVWQGAWWQELNGGWA